MSALLNLADFSEDMMIQSMAVQALEVLLLSVIDNVNSNGAFYPAQARSKEGRYLDVQDYTSNDMKVIHLLTGLGTMTDGTSDGSVFVATTNQTNLEGIMNAYTSTIDGKTTQHGIEVSVLSTFNDETKYPLSQDSRTCFQMQAGAFWIPEVVNDTLAFIEEYNLWQHPEFAPYKDLMQDPMAVANLSYVGLRPVTEGQLLTPMETVLYKDGPSMLSSMQDYYFEHVSSDVFPFAATTGEITVTGWSGTADDLDMQNVHLPLVKQVSNAALIKYDSSLMQMPEYTKVLGLFNVTDIATVYMQWPEERFDANRTVGNWLLGMEIGADNVEGYVALRRDDMCMNEPVEGVVTCAETEQMYALFVGNSVEYLSFDNFEMIVEDSKYLLANDTNILIIDGVSVSMDIL